MNYRVGILSDLPKLQELYRNTILKVNSKDYTQKEIAVWANTANNTEAWKNNFANETFFVAVDEGVITGFSSVTPSGYFNFMYVHVNYQGQGIGHTLVEMVEEKAREQGNTKLDVSVSKTARSFFEKHNYVFMEDEMKVVDGVVFINAIMEKQIV